MQLRNTNTSYGLVAKSLHWLVAALIIAMLCFGFFLGDFPEDMQPMVYNIHKLTGLAILFLMVIRTIWALTNPKPILPSSLWWWEPSAALISQIILYVLAIAMPVAGWIGASAAGYYAHIGNIKFMLPIDKNKPLSDFAFDIHGIVAIMLIIFISGHVMFALYHQFVRKDGLLRRMWF